jgi:hypothetical protein
VVSAAAAAAENDRRTCPQGLTVILAATLLYSYVEYVALRMARSGKLDPRNASPVVWFGHTEWHSLNFFDQARVVLAAEEYEEVSAR